MASNVHAWIQFNAVTYPLQRDAPMRIGRSIQSDLRIFEDTSISRDHCVIQSAGTRLTVQDLDSRNGTSLNGHRIAEVSELRHRDVIRLGESELTILLEIDPDDRGTSADVPLHT